MFGIFTKDKNAPKSEEALERCKRSVEDHFSLLEMRVRAIGAEDSKNCREDFVCQSRVIERMKEEIEELNKSRETRLRQCTDAHNNYREWYRSTWRTVWNLVRIMFMLPPSLYVIGRIGRYAGWWD